MSDTAKIKNPTKRDNLNALIALVEANPDFEATAGENIAVITADTLTAFLNHEIELLDGKAEAARTRAEKKKVEGDELRERVFNTLSTSEYTPIAGIMKALDDDDVSAQMITSRLSALAKAGRVEKDMVTVEVGGKNKKVAAYKAVVD